MKRSRLQILVASVVVALGAPSAAGADAVLDWNGISTNAILAPGPTAHGSTISGAMVQGAVYDAVNAIDRSHHAYLLDVRKVGAQPWASKDAAVATAAYRVLADLLPAQQPALEDLWEAALGPQPYDAITQDGIDAGEAAAAAMLDARENDGRNAPFTFVIGSEPGDWRPSPPTALDPAAWVGNVRPFVIPSPLGSGPTARTRSRVRSTRGTSTRSGAGLADEHQAHRGPDEGRHLLAGAASGDLRRADAVAVGEPRPRHGRHRPPVRDGPSGGCRRRDQLLERQVLLNSGVRSRRSARPTRTETRPPWPTRAGGRCSIQPPRPCRRSARRRSPTIRPGTAV